MHKTEIKNYFDQYWKPGWGSVSMADLMAIQDLIERKKPMNFVELGTASGISAGIIALMMDENSGQSLHTVDHNNTFFGDPSKENGFLIKDIVEQCGVNVVQHTFMTAIDLQDKSDEKFDMGFVDANHRHPWPTLDTLCLYPVMNDNGILIYDDYSLFQHQKPALGIGPKYLYDQIPESHKLLIDGIGDVGWLKGEQDDLFTFDTNLSKSEIEIVLFNSLNLPWTDYAWVLNQNYVNKLKKFISLNYSRDLVTHFDALVEYYIQRARADNEGMLVKVVKRLKRSLA